MITTNCPACGGIYNGRLTSRFITCEYCDTRYALGRKELEALGFVDEDGDGYDDYDSCPADDRRGSQVSSVPLPEFAREACEKFLKGVDNSYFKSTNKILRGLGIEGEDVYLIHDDTIFGSGKNGFAITQRGLYCRDFGEPTAHFVSWEDFAHDMTCVFVYYDENAPQTVTTDEGTEKHIQWLYIIGSVICVIAAVLVMVYNMKVWNNLRKAALEEAAKNRPQQSDDDEDE